MRLFLWIAGSVTGLAIAAAVVFIAIPQAQEKYLEMTCSMTAPDAACQNDLVRMGHVWSERSQFERAIPWYARAAEAGDAAAMFHLAWTYQRIGINEPTAGQPDRLVSVFGAHGHMAGDAQEPPTQPAAPSSTEQAAYWYRKAAQQGYAPAMNNLGQLYLFGVLGARDFQEAMRWHLAAARAGNPIAALNVSLAYRTGMGVPVDVTQARQWASLHVDQNSPDLEPVTLSRTLVYGSSVGAKIGATLRSAGALGEQIESSIDPLQPSAGMPSFHAVETPLSGPAPTPTLKQLQR